MMDDLISRKSAIEVASRECHEFRGIFADIEKGLNQLPSAHPDKDLIHLQKEQAYMQGYADGQKPRKGKWEIYGNRGCCSECHKFTYLGYDFNFCPNCGSHNGGDSDG